MAPLPDYVAGTITLTNGSANFTGTGTGWLAAGFREGDTILGIEDNPGVTYVVESVTDNDSGTLTQPWDGPTGTYTYRMRYLSDGQRVTAQARQLIELLGNGNLQAVAGLPGTPNTLMMFTGAGSVVEVPRTDLVSGANYDVQVPNLAARAAYDSQAEGFSALVSDTGDGRAAIYSKLSADSGDWSNPAYVTGPSITLSIDNVTNVPFGTDPDVTLTSVPGGYELAFELEDAPTLAFGAVTTLPSDQDATATFTPVTGGYELSLGIPRGPTGDIDGVTPFWQDRITNDVDAAAARDGLGATTVGSELFTAADADAARGAIGLGDSDSVDFASARLTSESATGVAVVRTGSTSNSSMEFTHDGGSVYSGHGASGRFAVKGDANLMSSPWFEVSSDGPLINNRKVFDYGSNANGEYVRFADGTQICWFRATGQNTGPVGVTLPVSFANSSYVITSSIPGTGQVTVPAVKTSGSTTSSFSFFVIQVTNTGNIQVINASADFLVIGRWF